MATQLEHTNVAQLWSLYEEAAQLKRSMRDFWDAYRQIDWSDKDAEFYLEIMKLVWGTGAIKLAREVGEHGLERFPNDPGLTQFARVIAPGVARITPQAGERANNAANIQWFKAHAAEYRDQWIAVHDGEFLGSAFTREALIEQLGGAVSRITLVTYIP